ncbi:MAG: energy-coupling factor ABC transporter permease [Neisseriaceae bacterium]|nr:energy-coupling factor ABC transporter permease [Neisseriaceae bacterium]MBO7554556.1 energy-coupling factor ABC transporter permease [Neisseriaceae bacterium]
MNFQLSQFPLPALILAWFMLGGVFFVAWYWLKKYAVSQNNWLAATIVAVFLWCLHGKLNTGELAGLHYHLLGLTLILLIVGLPAALFLLTATAAVYAVLFQQYQDIAAVSLYVMTVLFPALLLGRIILAVAQKILPHHIFIFIFVNGFLTALLTMFLAGVLALWLLDMAGAYSPELLWSRSFPVLFLLSWGEAFLTGLACAVLIAFAPQLLHYYSDEMYLPRRQSLF